MHLCEVRTRKDHRGVDPISDALPFGRLWYDGPNATDFVIKKLPPPHRRCEGRLFPPEQSWKSSTVLTQRPVKLCNLIETHEHKGDFKEW